MKRLFNFIRYLLFKFFKKLRLIGSKNSSIHNTSKLESGTSFVNSTIGKYSFCGYDCEITNTVIGSFCSIANGVVIGGGAHPIDWVSTSPVFYSGRDSVTAKFSEFERDAVRQTNIGSDVWIGQNAVIKQGVTIGSGAVIGMGSVVTKDVPPYTIVAGNPARMIRNRFEVELIKELLESEWWEMPDCELIKFANIIKSPEDFIDKLKTEFKE